MLDFLWRTIFGVVKSPKVKYLQTHLNFKKTPHTVLKSIYTNKLGVFCFQKKKINKNQRKFFSQRIAAFPTCEKRLIWVSLFCTENKFYTFFQLWLFSFQTILNTCLKNLFRKTDLQPNLNVNVSQFYWLILFIK